MRKQTKPSRSKLSPGEQPQICSSSSLPEGQTQGLKISHQRGEGGEGDPSADLVHMAREVSRMNPLADGEKKELRGLITSPEPQDSNPHTTHNPGSLYVTGTQ